MSDQQIPVATQEVSGTSGDKPKERNAILALILGIVGLVTWIIPLFGGPVSVIGFIFGIKGLKSTKRGIAIAGIVLCSIGFLATIVNGAIGAYQGATGQNAVVNQLLNQNQ